jgi:hypothetical protein
MIFTSARCEFSRRGYSTRGDRRLGEGQDHRSAAVSQFQVVTLLIHPRGTTSATSAGDPGHIGKFCTLTTLCQFSEAASRLFQPSQSSNSPLTMWLGKADVSYLGPMEQETLAPYEHLVKILFGSPRPKLLCPRQQSTPSLAPCPPYFTVRGRARGL